MTIPAWYSKIAKQLWYILHCVCCIPYSHMVYAYGIEQRYLHTIPHSSMVTQCYLSSHPILFHLLFFVWYIPN